MARIVYGVSGEGSGHSSRARAMASHLVGEGHRVRMVSYDRGYRNLRDDFEVFETAGLHIASRDNKVSAIRTLTENLARLPEGGRKLSRLRAELFKEFDPHCVITDFEPMTAYLANHYKLPLISLDNQHRMRFMNYPAPPGLGKDQLITESVIRAMVPRPDVAIVTTFYFGRTRNERTFLFPPILREEVLRLEPETGDHVLVYLTSGFDSFLSMLERYTRERFLVYGSDREGADGNLTFRPFSRDGFLTDLASCKAVMATAGFTLMTESLYLRKPYLALPMRGQFEQELNGHLLARLGYGINCRRPTGERIGNFLYHLPDYREQLASYRAADNRAICSKLSELVADDGALAREFRRRRKSRS